LARFERSSTQWGQFNAETAVERAEKDGQSALEEVDSPTTVAPSGMTAMSRICHTVSLTSSETLIYILADNLYTEPQIPAMADEKAPIFKQDKNGTQDQKPRSKDRSTS